MRFDMARLTSRDQGFWAFGIQAFRCGLKEGLGEGPGFKAGCREDAECRTCSSNSARGVQVGKVIKATKL